MDIDTMKGVVNVTWGARGGLKIEDMPSRGKAADAVGTEKMMDYKTPGYRDKECENCDKIREASDEFSRLGREGKDTAETLRRLGAALGRRIGPSGGNSREKVRPRAVVFVYLKKIPGYGGFSQATEKYNM